MRITTSNLTKAAGVSAALSGLLFIAIQFIHPEETLAAVTTDAWVVVGLLTMAMAVLGLAGVAGIYLRQAEETGIVGFLGFLFLGLFFLLTTAFTFAESLILPRIVTAAPQFVDNFMGIFNGAGTDGSVGVLETMGVVTGVLYLAGGVLLGIAVVRARILWTWAAVLLTAGAALAPFTSLVPHEIGRFAALPVGVALVGLGTSLWSERGKASSAESLEMPPSPTMQPAA